RRAVLVDAFEDSLADALALGHRRLDVILVIDADVVETPLVFLVHAPDAILDDDRELVRVGRIVNRAGRHGAEQEWAVTVLMLEPLAHQGAASRGAAHQETFAARI